MFLFKNTTLKIHQKVSNTLFNVDNLFEVVTSHYYMYMHVYCSVKTVIIFTYNHTDCNCVYTK